MGLKRYEKVRAGSLSGGNKRKLSVAMACIGNPPVVFLDEPSAGMDPEARKNMWRVINEIKRKKTSIILTTHSMDEAEALCERIGIMVAGRNRCLGNATHIKNKFGGGYELVIKVKAPSDQEVELGMQKIRNYVNESHRIPANAVASALETLGFGSLLIELTEYGVGSQFYQELITENSVSAELLIEWCIVESYGERIYNWLRDEFGNIALIEHFVSYFKYKIEVEGRSLGSIFGKIEEIVRFYIETRQ